MGQHVRSGNTAWKTGSYDNIFLFLYNLFITAVLQIRFEKEGLKGLILS